MKIKGRVKPFFYIFFTTLYLTGCSWWIFDKFIRIHTELGEDHHPAQMVIFRIHGVVAYLFLLLFGYLIHAHVRPGLLNKQKKCFKSGWGMILATSLMIVTSATDLFGPESPVRDFLISSHRYLGVGFPLFLGAHLLAKKWGPKHERFEAQ
jgi:hypothetical protein